MPLVLFPAGEMIQRWQGRHIGMILVGLLIAVSLFIQVLGISVNWARHLQRVLEESATSAEYFYRAHYRWADSPILGQARSLLEVLALTRDSVSRDAMRTLVDPAQTSRSCGWQSQAVGSLSFNVPDFWFVYLWFLGLPAGWLAGIALILVSTTTVAALKLRRALVGE